MDGQASSTELSWLCRPRRQRFGDAAESARVVIADHESKDRRPGKHADSLAPGQTIFLQLDEGVGTCGKDGQSVPVGVGIPTLKVDRLTGGGTGG